MSLSDLPHNAGRLDVAATAVEAGRVLSFRGEIDASTVAVLSAAIDQAMTEGSSRICVDLSGVEFIDSSGVAVLVRSAQAVEEAGGRFVVVCPDGPVGWVLQLTGIGQAISIVADHSACDGGGMSPAAAVPSPD